MELDKHLNEKKQIIKKHVEMEIEIEQERNEIESLTKLVDEKNNEIAQKERI